MNLFKRTVKLPFTQEKVDALVEVLLLNGGIPVDSSSTGYAGQFIQSFAPRAQDWFYVEDFLSFVRRALANECAYFLIHPDNRPKDETDNDTGTVSEATEEVVQEA